MLINLNNLCHFGLQLRLGILFALCKILLTVRGLFPGLLSTKIEYVLSVSNTINEIMTDKNYKLFISQGEIAFYHFKAYKNKKRLYISMTNILFKSIFFVFL